MLSGGNPVFFHTSASRENPWVRGCEAHRGAEWKLLARCSCVNSDRAHQELVSTMVARTRDQKDPKWCINHFLQSDFHNNLGNSSRVNNLEGRIQSPGGLRSSGTKRRVDPKYVGKRLEVTNRGYDMIYFIF